MISFTPGKNCWRTTHIHKGNFLLSGREYFCAFRKAMLSAEHMVMISAWDLSGKLDMIRRESDDDGYPSGLSDFLYAVLDEKPGLHLYILLWDYSLFYAGEREWLPLTRWRKEPHPRLHFETDASLPTGASHHQKMVIVDHHLALFGGYDLGAWRWDMREHPVHDSRRETIKGESYQPFHDIQMQVTGPIVDDLGDLFVMRWERAAETRLDRPDSTGADRWPEHAPVTIRNQPAALALTFARYKTYSESRHIEQVRLDLIREAREFIYIENQYLSSHTIVNALSQRLREEDGPELVMVLTRDTGGWVEEGTMGVLRDRLIELLEEADLHQRLGVYYPYVENEDGKGRQVYVHAKVMIADGRYLEFGSANLSNRSMKVDSEVDLVLAGEQPLDGVQDLLNQLLGIHYGLHPEQIADERHKHSTLNGLICDLGEHNLHRLERLEGGHNNWLQRHLANSQLLDPDEPLSPSHWLASARRNHTQAENGSRRHRTRILSGAKIAGLLLAGGLLAYLITQGWTAWFDRKAFLEWLQRIPEGPASVAVLFSLFFLSGLVAFPLNLLLAAATLALGPLITYPCALSASLLSAAVTYWVGKRGGRSLLNRLSPKRREALSKHIGKRGLFSIAAIRIMPVGPFPLINLIAGSAGIRFSTFMLGSVLGMAPGMLAVVLISSQFGSLLQNPSTETWLHLTATVAGAGLLFALMRHWLKKWKAHQT